MSRPNTVPSRPLGSSSSKQPSSTQQPNGVAPQNVPRRSAGTVPGIARTASSLRQNPSAPSPPAQSRTVPTLSLPHHLRNLSSSPRIPSPLGKGTPSRQPKLSLPVRTSKTTEKHVLLPESPQLAPLPASPKGSGNKFSLPPPSPRKNGNSDQGISGDERSLAEMMTKREREEAGLPRLTAYATADSYRLKLLQAFLKREHGVGVVRVFDDCVYAVYNLPLLPGYGASTKIRSSPAVKSPGGVSLLERMTQAEDLGYNDTYFPVTDDPTAPPFDPSAEYLLSHSPPVVSTTDTWQQSPQSEEAASPGWSETETASSESSGATATASVPPPAPAPVEENFRPKAERRKSRSSQPPRVAEAVFFNYGVSVFFGFEEGQEKDVMEDCVTAGVWQRPLEEDGWETEECHFVYDPDADYPRIYNDMFTFKSHSHLLKLSLSHAIAQSTKLSIYESIMQDSLALTSSFPKELSTTGHLELNRKEALRLTGRLFKLRMDVNLIGGVLDTPELFWSEASLYPLYEAIREYLEIGPRVQVLNDRQAVIGDLLEIIHDYIDQRAMHRVTWIVIWLIVVAILVACGEVVARLVFHAIPREEGEFMVLNGARGMLQYP